jgi:hypothetical protein
MTRPPTEAAFYRLKRAKYLVCNIYDATLKIIAVAKVKANIVIHICSSIAWQAGARPVSQSPAARIIGCGPVQRDEDSPGEDAPNTEDKRDICSPLAMACFCRGQGGLLKKEFFRNRGAGRS